MRVLVAEDDAVSRRVLEALLTKWGHDVSAYADGVEAWKGLSGEDPPEIALLDWMMPGFDGVELCAGIRRLPSPQYVYVILLTARDRTADIVEGLNAGADDYLVKPIEPQELGARVKVAERVVGLQIQLADRIAQLEDALSKVRRLQGLLPICAYCKRIRDDQNYWQDVEGYVEAHSDATFSRDACPDCRSGPQPKPTSLKVETPSR